MRRTIMTTAGAAALSLAVVTALAGPATASPVPAGPSHGKGSDRGSDVVAEGLAGPLSFDLGKHRTVVVGEAFSGAVLEISKKGRRTTLVEPSGREAAAVSVDGRSVTWSETTYGEQGPVAAVLMRRDHRGRTTQVADLYAHEVATNSDAANTYGFVGLDAACAATLPPFLQEYTGLVDSHPYGSVTVSGVTYVADAGANTIVRVRPGKEARTLAVLPPTPVAITAEIAAAVGVDPCVVGHDFLLEPVPTDVEVGRHGMLYVSTLPGGPEDGSLGANGAVYRVHPRTGAVELVASGLAGATGVAVAPDGTVYVAELFGNRVSAVDRRGRVRTVVELNEPAAVEWGNGRLYVATDVFGDGRIVSLDPGRRDHRGHGKPRS